MIEACFNFSTKIINVDHAYEDKCSFSLLDFCKLVSNMGTSSRLEVNIIDLSIECPVSKHKSSCVLSHGYRKGDERLTLWWGKFTKSYVYYGITVIYYYLFIFYFTTYIYNCAAETWILTATLLEKLDIFARTCYRIILGIKHSQDHVTNENLYHLTGQTPLRDLTFS